MRVLIVSDVHEKYGQLLHIEEHYFHKADRIVLLGDFWDTFHPMNEQGLIATWLLSHIYDPKFTVLWGNHDANYAFNAPSFGCSGYNYHTKALLNKEFPEDAWRKFKLFTNVGKFVVSHAGFHPTTVALMDQADFAVEEAFSGRFHPLWAAGRSSGGHAPFGGPTWLRWWEMEALDFPQIVGHTIGNDVRYENGNICLDTHLNHIAFVDEDNNNTEIIEV